MDVRIEKKQPILKKKGVWQLTLALVSGLVAYMLFKPTNASINTASIWSGVVQQGDLQSVSYGFGKLKSNTPRLLTAHSNATVDSILLKPGAVVTPNSILMQLKDESVEQSVRVNQRALLQMENAYRQLEINQTRELLAQQAELEILTAELESAELEVAAQAKLIEQGIISNIDYQRRVLQKRQLTRRLALENQRLTELKRLHSADLEIAESNISSQQGVLDLANYRQQQLTVRAGISGVLQNLSVELGQSVTNGQQLALVGSATDLYALVDVPQSQIQAVSLGQSAVVDTRAGIIQAEVTRIDPIINGGNVRIELSLKSELPLSARPELNITAEIETGLIKNALYIEKPVNAKPHTHVNLFRLDKDGELAVVTAIEYGIESQDKIQIVSGATAAERFILSDMSRWQSHTQISVN